MVGRLDHHMVEVELVDGPADLLARIDPFAAVEPEAPEPPAPVRPRRRAVRLVGVLVVVGLVVTANVAERAQEQERRLAIASMPGLVTSLASPLEALWEEGAGRGAVLIGDVLLAVDPTEIPSVYQAVEIATGRELWSAERGPGGIVDWCSGRLDPADASSGTPPLAVCWKTGFVPDSLPGGMKPGTTHLVALSLVDGTAVVDEPMDVPDAGYGTVGSDLVVAGVAGSILTLRRFDPVTDTERWAAQVPLQVPGPDGTARAHIEVVDGFVIVSGPTTAVVSVEDGAVLGTWNAELRTDGDASWEIAGAEVTTSDQGFAVWSDSREGFPTPVGSWYDRQGTFVVDVPGGVVEPRASDGSDADVLLVNRRFRTELQAVSARSGDVLWSVDLRSGTVLTRRGGAVVIATGERLVSKDVRTGEELWSTDVDGLRTDAGSVTDGQHVVVVAFQGADWMLRAVDLDSGEITWSQAAPESSSRIEAINGRTEGLRIAAVEGHVLAVRQRSVLGLG
jgi:outer membrane protein assembly factor BamB